MQNTIVAILDSGLESTCTEHIVGGVRISASKDNAIQITNDFEDDFGHGTAIYHILKDACPNAYFYIVKMFENEHLDDSTVLLEALKHMLSIDCDFIIISSGTYVIENIEQLNRIIKELTKQNKVIISAFSNDGGLSYPAAHQNVIGVDTCANIPANTIYIVKNSPIQLILPNKKYRLKWLNEKKVIVQGTSFAAALILAEFVNIYEKKHTKDKEVLIENISKQKRVIVYDTFDFKTLLQPKFFNTLQNSRIAVFPFSKETSVLAANESLVSAANIEYYDVRCSGKVGINIQKLIHHGKNNKKIRDVDELHHRDDYDLIVCGHCDVLNQLTSKNWSLELIELAAKKNKYFLSFDPIQGLDCQQMFSPPMLEKYSDVNLGKMWHVNAPVLGVFGTSRSQGKFTLQLKLREKFIKDKYKVVQVSTEPSGNLFGIDYICPIGYNASVKLKGTEATLFYNSIMHLCDENEPDIIMFGSQSSTIAANLHDIRYNTAYQLDVLLGFNPDAVVLVVNRFDNMDYIVKTIRFIESVGQAKVLCLVISFLENSDHLYQYNEASIDFEEFSRKFNIPVFLSSQIDRIYQNIISYFGD